MPHLHPTQKPLALVKYLIETYTKPGELILDSCAGCGTTGLAALTTGRQFVQIERDPEYYGVAKNRTGEQ
ncbi:MAG: site-specific DNA-methyltransferase [Bacteroidetes bacterium]|nr:site-specific DNA-methyltransferase [Bacteroidota bacterium]